MYFLHSLILKGIMILSSPLGAGEAARAISCREGLWELLLPGGFWQGGGGGLLCFCLLWFVTKKVRRNNNCRNSSVSSRCLSISLSCWAELVPCAGEAAVQPRAAFPQGGRRTMGIPYATVSGAGTHPGWGQSRQEWPHHCWGLHRCLCVR